MPNNNRGMVIPNVGNAKTTPTMMNTIPNTTRQAERPCLKSSDLQLGHFVRCDAGMVVFGLRARSMSCGEL